MGDARDLNQPQSPGEPEGKTVVLSSCIFYPLANNLFFKLKKLCYFYIFNDTEIMWLPMQV